MQLLTEGAFTHLIQMMHLCLSTQLANMAANMLFISLLVQ